MDLNEFYTISYNDYKNKILFRNSDISLLERLNDDKNDITLRIYKNKKLIFRVGIYHNKIKYVYKGNEDYVKFNLINIKKKLLQNSLKLLDSDDSLNHALFLEILKQQLELNIQ